MNKVLKDLTHLIPDELYLRIVYYHYFHKKLNLRDPKTFNEKLQWLKLYDRNPKYTNLVDKHEVKRFVKNIIGEEYIVPTIAIFDNVNDIDIDKLPNQFVLKTTHDSGGVRICVDKEKFDLEEAKQYLYTRIRQNYYYIWREWPYKNVKPRIIAEEYINTDIKVDLKDYKIMCFNGIAKYVFVCSDRQKKDLKVTFYDMEWNMMPFERHYPKSNFPINKPTNFLKMKDLAERLAENLPFIRVDFYEVENRLYFGELTFFPGTGLEEFAPEVWDYKLGEELCLPKKNK